MEKKIIYYYEKIKTKYAFKLIRGHLSKSLVLRYIQLWLFQLSNLHNENNDDVFFEIIT